MYHIFMGTRRQIIHSWVFGKANLMTLLGERLDYHGGLNREVRLAPRHCYGHVGVLLAFLLLILSQSKGGPRARERMWVLSCR
jgi:hypothetical protein